MSDIDVISEKFNNNEKEHEELKKEIDKLDGKIEKINTEVNKRIDNTEATNKDLNNKWIALETTYKLMTEQINNNISKVEKKIDKIIEKDEKEDTTKDTRLFEWLKSIGLIVIGIVITYLFKRAGF